MLDPARLRAPQIGGFEAVRDYFAQGGADREVALVLPVGCGKSTLIAILPFAVHAGRALVIAPNLHIAGQLREEVNPTNPDRNALHKHVWRAEIVLFSADGVGTNEIMRLIIARKLLS